MLHLMRRVGETVNIGDDIIVTILSIKGNQIQLGFNAPKSVPIHREEVYFKIQKEKVQKRNQEQLSNEMEMISGNFLNHQGTNHIKH